MNHDTEEEQDLVVLSDNSENSVVVLSEDDDQPDRAVTVEGSPLKILPQDKYQ